MKITNFGTDGLPQPLGAWSSGVVATASNALWSSAASNTLAVNGVTVTGAAASNYHILASSSTAAAWVPDAGGGTVSAGSNSTRVREVSTAGASTTLWSPFDHAHDGIGTITASASNTMQRGTMNLRPGAGIALSLTDTDGDGEFDTATIVNTGVPGPAGSGSGSGALVFLEAHTAAVSASLDFTTFISSTYDDYLIEGLNLVPATNAVIARLQVGTGAGPTYDTSANYYNIDASAAAVGCAIAPAVSNVAEYGQVSFSLRLLSPQSTAQMKQIIGLSTWHNGTNVLGGAAGALWATAATALTAVRFLFSSGNITSGVIRIYGIAKS